MKKILKSLDYKNMHCRTHIYSVKYYLRSMDMVIMNDNQLEIRPDEYKKARQVYRAINHRLRQNMLHYIHTKARVSVTELHKYFGLEQSETSMHLALLRKAGFVITHRDGRFIFYAVNYPRLKEIHNLSEQLIIPHSSKSVSKNKLKQHIDLKGELLNN